MHWRTNQSSAQTRNVDVTVFIIFSYDSNLPPAPAHYSELPHLHVVILNVDFSRT